jgi:C-terminal processing protease CtpA/Prc
LNEIAVRGLLDQLRGRVVLVTNAASALEVSPAPAVSKFTAFDETFAYVRLARVARGAGAQLTEAAEKALGTNKMKGLVLDLRFATGFDYAAVGELADRLVETDGVLFRTGDLSVKRSGNGSPWNVPVVLLVNSQTAGAAEIAAAVLRKEGAGLIIGNQTSGQAHPFTDHRLSNGQVLKIASGRIETADGSPLLEGGVAPDIRVNVSPEDERAYLEDPYRVLPRPGLAATRSGTNSVAGISARSRRRINEAELVRMQREGSDAETTAEGAPEAPAKPALQDPVLARALDLIKGLAVAQSRR